MKKLYSILLFLLPYYLKAQNPFPINQATNKILYQDVVRVDSVSASDLRQRAKDWLFNVIKSPKSAIEIDSDNSLAANITYDYANNPGSPLSKRARVYIPLQIEFKDGRYRYTITNLKYGPMEMATMQFPLEKLATEKLGKADQRSAEGINDAIGRLVIESLRTALTSKGKDW